MLCQAHEESEGFNPGWLEDENERVVAELPGSCVTPLCSQPGRVALTATRIYFQPFNISSTHLWRSTSSTRHALAWLLC